MQKKAYNIQNMAKVWNQEKIIIQNDFKAKYSDWTTEMWTPPPDKLCYTSAAR